MPGPKPTPTRLKILRGNPGKRPINRDEPQPEPLDAAPPSVLTSAKAKAEWTRAIVPAIRIGQVTAADYTLAIAHCELFASWQNLIHRAAKKPPIVASGKFQTVATHPLRALAAKTLAQLLRVDDALGFSPTSRSRVTVSTMAPLRPASARAFDTTGRG